MKKIKIIGAVLILFIGLVFIISKINDRIFGDPFAVNNIVCKYYEDDKFLVFKGIINRAFEDKENHNTKTLLIENNGDIQVFYLAFDKSGLFEYLQKGDSVIKKYKSYDIIVKRNDEVKVFKLDYNCDKSILNE
jgi:hypothetical protein